MVGVTCAALGAHVTLTDVASVLPLTRTNVEANAGLIAAAGGSALVSELEWGAPDSALVQYQQYDWVLGKRDDAEQ